jgi:hypothetical protein
MKSRKFARDRVYQLTGEIERVSQIICGTFFIHDFEFLIDTARLVLEVRRALSYTYALRYNLRGKERQELFDFIVKDMERALETLTRFSEEKLTD